MSKQPTINVFTIGGPGKFPEEYANANHIGGKAFSLVSMTNLGLPVPPAFVIPCEVTFQYQADPMGTLEALRDSVKTGLDWIEQTTGRKCLFSVRSGAPISMPGMMDTVLNVGLNKANMPVFNKLLGQDGVWDSQRRLMQMWGTTVLGLEAAHFDKIIENTKGTGWKKNQAVVQAFETVQALKEMREMSPLDQVLNCIAAVFGSWMSPRAIEYRKLNNIPDDLGTAVTIQAMVYGNLNDKSGSGVLFTRDPSTGENKIMAEYLANAQGEDVVAGTHTPIKLSFDHLHAGVVKYPAWHHELAKVCAKLEEHYHDMVDVEFTVEDEKLYILQSRRGKRTHRAAVKIVIDMLNDGQITPDNLSVYLTKDQVLGAASSQIVKTGSAQLIAKGLPAGGGVVMGRAIMSVDMAVDKSKTEPVVLVREETLPDDIAGMAASVGIVTFKGGATSHAAVVSRAMNKACVVGLGKHTIQPDWQLVVNGDTGEVWHDDGSMVLSEGGDDIVLELAGAIAQHTGQALAYKRPLSGVRTVVLAADSMFSTDDYGFLVGYLMKSNEHIVLDTTPPKMLVHEADRDIWNLLEPTFDSNWKELLQHLVKATMAKENENLHVVTTSQTKTLFTHCKPIRSADTIEDVFGGDMVILGGDFIERVCGSQAMYDKLVDALGAPNVFGESKDPYQLILSALS